MAWNDPNELVVGGTGQVYVADIGTSLPAVNSDPTAALSASWVGLGYTTEDGVAFSVTPDVTDFKAWQSRLAVRREFNAQELQVTCSLEQWNEETVVLAFGGGAITNAGGFYTYTFPAAGDALDERSMVVDVQDGTRNMRIVIPRGNVTDAVEAKFQRTELAVLPITFKSLEATDGTTPYIIFDDAAAFTAGS
jgi:hypothetical protein